MTVVSSLIYILMCALLATWLMKWVTIRSADEYAISKFLAWVVIFFAVLFGCFHILGFVNLATNLPVVNPFYGAVLASVALAGFGIWSAKRMPGFLKTGVSIERLGNPGIRDLLPVSGLCLMLMILTVLTFTSIALMLMVGFPRGYEPQAYHLPIALHMLQARSLKIWDAAHMHTYPGNASIYFGLLLGFLSEHVVAAAGLVFLFVLFVAVYGIGRTTGADKDASVMAALGLLTIPIITFSAFGAGADVGGAAFLGIALYFAVAKSGRDSSRYVLAGLAAGLAFGFKSLHLVGIAFLSVLLLLQSLRVEPRRDLWLRVKPASIFLLSTLAIAGFWLLRNYVQLDNPLYPVHLPIFDILGWRKAPDKDFTQLSYAEFEWVRSPIEWLVYPWIEWHFAGENFKASSGLGAFFAATVPVACLSGFIGVLKASGNNRAVIGSLPR